MFIIKVPSVSFDFFAVAGNFIVAEKHFPEKMQVMYDVSEIIKRERKSAAAITEPENEKIIRKTNSAMNQKRNDIIRLFFILEKTP